MLTLNSEFKIREVKPKEKPVADKPVIQPLSHNPPIT